MVCVVTSKVLGPEDVCELVRSYLLLRLLRDSCEVKPRAKVTSGSKPAEAHGTGRAFGGARSWQRGIRRVSMYTRIFKPASSSVNTCSSAHSVAFQLSLHT